MSAVAIFARVQFLRFALDIFYRSTENSSGQLNGFAPFDRMPQIDQIHC